MVVDETILSPSCWVISEGHAGMENQAIGLAEAMGLDPVIKRVKPRRPWVWLPSGMWPLPLQALAPGSDEIAPPWPEIIITSGRRSVPYSLFAGRASAEGIFRIHIQNPQCRLERFNLVITPEHDNLAAANLINSLGALHRVTANRIHSAGREFKARFAALSRPLAGVLIGGTSSSYRLDEKAMTGLLGRLEIVAKQGLSLAVTPSRRTGSENISRLHERLAPLGADIWDMQGPNPYFGILKYADFLIVTNDSVTMVSEAVSTGKPVYIYDLPGGSRKFDAFHQSLRQRGFTRPLDGPLEAYEYAALDETGRIAELTWQRVRHWKTANVH